MSKLPRDLKITNLKLEEYSVCLRKGLLKKIIESAIFTLSQKYGKKVNNKELAKHLKKNCKSLQNLAEKSISDNYLMLWKYHEKFVPLDCLIELCKLANIDPLEIENKIERIKQRCFKNSVGIPFKDLTKIEKTNTKKGKIQLPGFLRVTLNTYRKPHYQFELVIYNSKLAREVEKIRKNNRDLVRAMVYFTNDRNVVIEKHLFGNLLRGYPKSQVARISVANFLTSEMKNKIISKKRGFRVSVQINPKEWNLSHLDMFLESKENRDLAKELISLNYKVIPITTNNPKKLKYGVPDLILEFKNQKIPIEITTFRPTKLKSNSKRPNAPHGSTWARVSGRILPIFLYGLEKHLPTFIIINEKWKKFKHCRILAKKLKKFNCFIFFSNFQKGWHKKIANKIDNIMKGIQYDLPWY